MLYSESSLAEKVTVQYAYWDMERLAERKEEIVEWDLARG
jgi:hypothetical protein